MFGLQTWDQQGHSVSLTYRPWNLLRIIPVHPGTHSVTIPWGTFDGRLHAVVTAGYHVSGSGGVYISNVSVSGNRITYTAIGQPAPIPPTGIMIMAVR